MTVTNADLGAQLVAVLDCIDIGQSACKLYLREQFGKPSDMTPHQCREAIAIAAGWPDSVPDLPSVGAGLEPDFAQEMPF